MPMKRKYARRKPRKTRKSKARPRVKKASMRTKIKKTLFDLSETKSFGRVIDQRLTLGTLSNTWHSRVAVLPDNGDANMTLPEGTQVNERIGNRITLRGIRIPVYLLNQTPEALRIRVIVYKQSTNVLADPLPFLNPLSEGEAFNYEHPWQADYTFNRELGKIVKQRTFTLAGTLDWGSNEGGVRPIQFTGNTGIKRLEMGFSFKNKQHFFDQAGDEFRNIDHYKMEVYIWRLYGNDVPYNANHLAEGLGNLRIRQFQKVYYKDI
ncbi:hypothetical protein [Rheinheimera sp.]|uniref:hypothetical protein n=1 Tax=Rheinheimera sp. TaxID=1869214 RepID=UPI0040474BF0